MQKGVIGHDMALGTTWPQHNQQILKLITPKIENCIITKALGCEKLQETETHIPRQAD